MMFTPVLFAKLRLLQHLCSCMIMISDASWQIPTGKDNGETGMKSEVAPIPGALYHKNFTIKVLQILKNA